MDQQTFPPERAKQAALSQGDADVPLHSPINEIELKKQQNTGTGAQPQIVALDQKQQGYNNIPQAPQQLQSDDHDISKGVEKSAIQIQNKIELGWRDLTISIDLEVPKPNPNDPSGKPVIVKQNKVILNNLKGVLRPGEFTAILGPSGSGKTTLLNLLSGRLTSQNMQIQGELYLNSQRVPSVERYSNQIAYVMQDDILLATFSPRESFLFVTNLRLPHLNPQEKIQRVDQLIKELGLTRCANTYIGNQFIRGVSGGERKRTSIGVELLTNPSMIFLDEPTTGLDSSTAFSVIELLKHLSRHGVNVVSTIHQPSSEIFALFHKLLLLVRGNIIYHGDAQTATDYLDKHGFPLPPYSNPSDFFMKLMNEEGLMIEKLQRGEELPPDTEIEQEFSGRLANFITYYQEGPMSKEMQDLKLKDRLEENLADYNVSFAVQFAQVITRAFKNEIRNPNIVRMKIIQQIVFAVACIIVFNKLEDPEIEGRAAIQNRSGLLFFLTTMQAFTSFQDSLGIFAEERNLFLRERLNGSYSVGAYFWGKSLAEFPFQVLYPLLCSVIVYFSVKLQDSAKKFWILAFSNILTYFTGTSYGLLISVLIPNPEIALALVPLLVIPFMVMGGLFVSSHQIPVWLRWLSYLSMFKYGFQSSAQNEYEGLTFNCACIPYSAGADSQYVDILTQYNQEHPSAPLTSGDCVPDPCNPFTTYDFPEGLWESMWIQFVLGISLRILALIGMYVISNPKRPVIHPVNHSQLPEGQPLKQGQIRN